MFRFIKRWLERRRILRLWRSLERGTTQDRLRFADEAWWKSQK